MSGPDVAVVGAGFAGVEAAVYLARRGLRVDLWEMRPTKMSPAHQTGDLCEVVCSNSFGGSAPSTPAGVLKGEMRALQSVTLEAADETQVPAGGALAVDRERFARAVTERVLAQPGVRLVRDEAAEPPGPLTVLATGPLTSDALAKWLEARCGAFLAFYDAAAPIVFGETVNLERAFPGNRWQEGAGDYLNCPLTKDEYDQFWQELSTAERVVLRGFESQEYFESCLPIEVLATRGRETLRFGPMRPVGLPDPHTGRVPYALVQLRQDNATASLYNLVGFQTGLRWREQKRVLRMIPGLEQAEFARYGVMHRNLFVQSPSLLAQDLSVKTQPQVFLAGQMAGVEGYMESAALGIYVGIQVARRLMGDSPLLPPAETMLGALVRYLLSANPDEFQPMNANFGLLPEVPGRLDRRARKLEKARRSQEAITAYARTVTTSVA